VVVIGTQVFGLRNSPFLGQDANGVSLVVANDLLRTNGQAKWMKLFSSTPPHLYSIQAPIGFAATAIVLLASRVAAPPVGGSVAAAASETALGSLYAISGSKIKDLKILLPTGARYVDPNTDTLRTFWLPEKEAANYKSVVVQNGGGAPIVLALPSPSGGGGESAAPPKRSIKAQATPGIAATTKTLKLSGAGMSQVVAVLSAGTPLAFTAPDDQSLSLTLPALVAPGVTVVFIYMDKSLESYFIPVAAGAAR
jgi:hypothetical protein